MDSGLASTHTLNAYFDAGGDRRRSVLVVAGFVSSFRKWTRFEKAWNSILKSEGVTLLHMTDFVASKGEFKGWKGPTQTDRRRAFIDKLLTCTQHHIHRAFSTVVVMSDYDTVNKEYALEELAGYPFALAGWSCITMAEQWRAKRNKPNNGIFYLFEDGDQNRGLLRKFCDHYSLRMEFIGKKAAPLQAADLLAWKTRTAFEEIYAPNPTPEKMANALKSFNLAWKAFPLHQAMHADEKHLRDLCAHLRIPKRLATVKP